MRVYIRRFLVTPYTLIRQNGVLFLFVYIFRWIRWRYLTCQVRKIYFASQVKQGKPKLNYDENRIAEEIATYGLDIISEIKKKYTNLYSKRENLRFLFNMPPKSGALYYYFIDLAQCLQHSGAEVYLYTATKESLELILTNFRPTVFITGDSHLITQTLDTEVLVRYKETYGLVRLFVPYYSSPLKPTRESLSKESVKHMNLHSEGKLADAFIGYFENVFWTDFCDNQKHTGLNYYSIPFAANPMRHYPMRTTKNLDWAIATANSNLGERAALTFGYMRKIIAKYHGSIAGHNWGEGIDVIPPAQIADFFSRAKISPNISPKSNVLFPLDCGAKVHELSAMGVFQISSETEALRQYYSSAEIVGVRSPDEFNTLFDYFVGKPEVRYMFVKNGMDRTLNENTYFHRIEKLIEILDQNPEWFKS